MELVKLSSSICMWRLNELYMRRASQSAQGIVGPFVCTVSCPSVHKGQNCGWRWTPAPPCPAFGPVAQLQIHTSVWHHPPPYLSFSLEAYGTRVRVTSSTWERQRMCPSVIFASLFPFQVVCFELPPKGRASWMINRALGILWWVRGQLLHSASPIWS